MKQGINVRNILKKKTNMQISFGYNGLARLQKHDEFKTKKWNES